MAAIPLKTTHAPPSALVVYSPEPQVFSERQLNLLSTFANQAAMAIENAALYARSDARLQEQTRRLVALIQSLDLGLVLADLEGKVLYANRMVGELSGEPLDEIIGQPVADWWRRVRVRRRGT
jgi:PAS domain-containing protein